MTLGSALGSIQDLFAKIAAIDAKHGKFDFALCTGDFFGPIVDDGNEDSEIAQLLDGRIQGIYSISLALVPFLTPVHPSTHRMLHHARGEPHPRFCDPKIR